MSDLWADDAAADDGHQAMVERRNEFEQRVADLAQELGHAPSAEQQRGLWHEVNDEPAWGDA